jgi:hypothetical protein
MMHDTLESTRVAPVLSVAAALAVTTANAQAVLSIGRTTTQSVSVGSAFSVDVNIGSVSNLHGCQFDLTFNPSVLSAAASSEGSFFGDGRENHALFYSWHQ